MDVQRIVPNLTVTDLPAAVAEHVSVLGLRVVMDHGWIVTPADDHVEALTSEEWGVRRFFYRDSSGRVVNVGSHG